MVMLYLAYESSNRIYTRRIVDCYCSIAILATITVVAYNGIQGRAKSTQIVANIKSIQRALEAYKAYNGSYPATPSNMWQYQRASGDSFIPGLTPGFVAALPSITDGPASPATNNTLIYRSDGVDYKLARLYQPSIPAPEKANIPTEMIDPHYSADRYGVWTLAAANW